MSPPREVKATSRSERSAALQASAQAYANALEEMVRQHPFQWYIFEPFFGSVSADMRKSNPSFSARIQEKICDSRISFWMEEWKIRSNLIET